MARSGADEQRRARDEGDGAPGRTGLAGAAVERRPHRLVRGRRAGAWRRRRPRSAAPPPPPAGRRSGRAAARATRGGHAVGVDEGDERAVDRGQSGVAGAEGPTLTGSATNWAPWRSAISLVAPASADASSTTMQASPPSAPSRRSSCAGRSRTGTTTVTSSGPKVAGPAAGRAPRRRPAGAPGAPPAGRRRRRPRRASAPPAARARSEIRKRRSGLPPRSTVPPSKLCVEASSVRAKEPGSGVVAGGARAAAVRVPGVRWVGHRPILAVRGRG